MKQICSRFTAAWASALLLLAVSNLANAQIVPTGKLPGNVTPLSYQLELAVSPSQEKFSGVVQITVRIKETTNIIWLHGRRLTATKAGVLTGNGIRTEAIYSEIDQSGVVKLEFKELIEPGVVVLEIEYNGPFSQSLSGLYKVKSGAQTYFYTQLQPLRARQVFPGFDEPRFKTPFNISVTIPKSYRAISNAPEKATLVVNDDSARVVFAETKPIPTYLVALAIGDFDVVKGKSIPANSIRSRPIPLRGIAPKGQGEKLKYALENTAPIMKILEEYFGTPYPYAKLDLVAPEAFNPSGMENVGAFFYRKDKILMDDNPSVFQKRGFMYVHAHELSHSWFGNLVTPLWWDDLWLNEAFATWMADKVVNAWKPLEYEGRGVIRGATRAKWNDRLLSARQIRQPITTNGDISSAFDSITYSKGGAVLSMIEQFMGYEAFRDGIRLFVKRHANKTATAADLFAALSETASDPKLIASFKTFVEQPGIPLVSVDWICDQSGTTTVNLKQSRSLPLGSKADPAKKWSIPMCMVYQDAGKRQKQCFVFDQAQMSIPLQTKTCPAWILPNSNGAAYMNFSLPDKGWQALVQDLNDLKPSEILSTISSIGAGYEAGSISTERLLLAAKTAAKSPNWDVVKAPVQDLRNLKNYVLTIDQRPEILSVLRKIFKPALSRFDLNDAALSKVEKTSRLALLRSDLIWFMALEANDSELARQFSRLGRSYLGIDTNGKRRREVLHPSLVRIGMIAATQQGGLPVVEYLIERLSSTKDATFRKNIIATLGFQTDPKLGQRVRQAILNPKTRKWVASRLLRSQSNRVDNREALFSWIVKNYDALEKRIPASHRKWLVWRASAFCTTSDRDRVKAFFSDKIEKKSAGIRAMANVLEAIEICAAIQENQKAEAIKTVTEFK